MSRLFGCICNQPERVVDALAPVRSALVAPAPMARWGLGYIQSGEVLLSRNPRARTRDLDVFEILPRYVSDYLIVHAADPDGLSGNANTQPFRFRRWMFAQTGGIDDMSALQADLSEHMPGFVQRNVRGKTAAEHVFHLFLSLLHDTGSIDEADLPHASVRQAIRTALALVYGAAAKAGVSHALGNIAMTNGRSFFAVRLTAPLYLRRLSVPGPRGTRDERFRGVVVVGDAPEPPGEGFEEIPQQSMLSVSRDVSTLDVLSLDS